MRILLFISFFFVSVLGCDSNQQKQSSTHPELQNRSVPDGYEKFVAFNNGFEFFYPEDWTLREKAKHEYASVEGPKPQSASNIKPNISVTIKRGKRRFVEGADPTFIKFEFDEYGDTYFDGVSKRMGSFELIEEKEAVINQSKTRSFKFTFADPESDLTVYQELVLIGLPYRAYLLSMSCLNDELFRNKDHFEVVKASFLAKAREDASF